MLARHLIVAVLMAPLGGQAHAAAEKGAKKYYVPPAPRSAPAPLKPPVSSVDTPAPPAALRTGGSPLVSALAPPPSRLTQGMSRLPVVGDTTPACRSACAQTRYVCMTADDQICDTEWALCVAGCRP